MKLKVLTVLLSICAILVSAPITASANYYQGQYAHFKFLLDNATQEATITGVDDEYKKADVLTVPSTLYIYKVKAIGESAFFGCQASRIIVEEGVEELKPHAFLGILATEVELPSTIKTMEKETFYGCVRLEKVIFKHRDVSIPEKCFYNCIALKSTKDVITPGSIKRLESRAFSGCTSLKEIDLDRVESVGYNVFECCTSLESAIIPESVSTNLYGGYLFTGCTSLKTVTINVKNLSFSLLGNVPAIETIIVGDNTEILDGSFKDLKSLKTVKLGSGMKTLRSAFVGCSALSDIEFPDTDFTVLDNIVEGTAYEKDPSKYDGNGIMYIGSNLVKGENAEGDVRVRDGVVNISEKAFKENAEITSVTLPDSVKTIYTKAFAGCSGLTKVKAEGMIDLISPYAFASCASLTDVDFSAGIGKCFVNAFAWSGLFNKEEYCDNGSILYIGNTLIGSNAPLPRHYDIRVGTETILPNAFSWGYGAIDTYGKDMSVSINIPEGVKSIEDRAFFNTGTITSAVIPKSVKTIGKEAFYGTHYDSDDEPRDSYEGYYTIFYYYSGPKDIYYLGTKADWDEIEKTDAIEDRTTVHFAKDFKDVPDGKWYSSGARYCSARGLMDGTGGGAFSPDAKMTRAMFVTVLAKLAGADLSGYKAGSFSDVKAGKWYSAAVEWAVSKGYTSGTGGGRFSPDKPLKREELVQFMYTYAKMNGKDVSGEADLSGFKDLANLSSWAVNAMKWGVEAGMIAGTSPDTLSPESTATRAQAAVILMRFAQNVID